MYPGEENELGMVSLHGTEYIVDDIRGTQKPLTDVAVCDNEECDRRFRSFDPDETICPHCDLTSRPHKSTASRQLSAW